MQFVIPTLNSGEVSDLVAARGDVKARTNGGSLVQNFLPLVQGPIISRPGTRYITSVYDSTKKTQLIGMNTASGTNYLVEMSQYVFRFITNNALVTGSSHVVNSMGGSLAVTITIASPAVITWANHGLSIGSSVKFTTSGSLPTGITAGTTYYVQDVRGDEFKIASYPGGAAINTSGAQASTHTCYHNLFVTNTENSFNENDLIRISGATGVPTLVNGDYCAKNVSGLVSDITVDTATNVITWTGHGLSVGDKVRFYPNTFAGSLPSPLTVDTDYYVLTAPTSDTITISDNPGGNVIDITTAGGGSRGQDYSNMKRFEIRTIDGNIDFASGDKDVTTYTALAGSPVVLFFGKMHNFSESVMFDSNNRFDLGTSVQGDTLFITHKNYWPRKLRVDSSTDWDYSYHAHATQQILSGFYPYFVDGPYTAKNTDAKKQIPLAGAGVLDSDITIYARNDAGTAISLFLPTHVGMVMRVENDNATKPGYLQFKTYTQKDQAVCYYRRFNVNYTASPEWRFGLYGAHSGYPHRISFYQDRMCLSMMDDYPTRVDMSESGSYTSFSPTSIDDRAEVLDSNSINFEIPGAGIGKIVWTIGGGSSFLIGVEGGVFSISGTESSLLTPGKVRSNSISTYGAENIQPIQIGQDIYYVEKGGVRLRAIKTQADLFDSVDVTRLAPHILEGGVKSMAYAASPFSTLWMIRADGVVISLTVDAQDGISAFGRHILGGSLSGATQPIPDSVATIRSTDYQDDVFFCVKRTINGSTVRHIERLEQSPFIDSSIAQEDILTMDCAYTYDSTPATTITGLSHLEGQAVDVVADSVIITGKTVSGGQITLSTAASVVNVGLAFRPKFETTNLEAIADNGSTLGRKKRITEVDVGFYKSLGAKIGRNSDFMNEVDFGKYTHSAQTLFTGVKKQKFNSGHDETNRVRIEQHIPAPICITFINAEGEVYG